MTGQSALDRVAQIVHRESGLTLPSTRNAALKAALRRAGADGAEAFLALAAGSGGRAAIDRLLDEVTVQETSFFRDAAQLAAIDWQGLYAAATRAGEARLRVWSAGCATGEEAYTLAILASEAFASVTPPVTIVATDLSERALEQARAGRFAPRRALAVPADLRRRYLTDEGDRLAVGPALQRLVRFVRHNLVRDPAPPAGEQPFDAVVCRNVLIYFDAPTADAVLDSLREALRPDGLLLLGAADQLGRTQREPEPEPAGAAAVKVAPGERLALAVAAADAGRPADALAEIDLLLASDRLNAEGHFLRGLVELPDDPRAAIDSLGRALLIDPQFGLAAFQLGRAYDAAGDVDAALVAYRRALDMLDAVGPGDSPRSVLLLGQIDPADVASAIRARIEALR